MLSAFVDVALVTTSRQNFMSELYVKKVERGTLCQNFMSELYPELYVRKVEMESELHVTKSKLYVTLGNFIPPSLTLSGYVLD